MNETLLSQRRGLKVAHDDEHGQKAEGRGEDDRNEEEPLDHVGVADHAARVVAHVQQLQVDVQPDGDEWGAPADAQIGLEIITCRGNTTTTLVICLTAFKREKNLLS